MIRVLAGDCREVLKNLPDESVHCCVTSPPYWGLRDYGVSGQIGLEPSPDAYVATMVEVFREVWRVLRDDGTLWLNIGDSYCPENRGENAKPRSFEGYDRQLQGDYFHADLPTRKESIQAVKASGIKRKDLIGIPWRVAFALQADGWWLRQDIIWQKPNPMPESVTDRCTKAHEYIFLLSKSERYYYDADAIAEPSGGFNGSSFISEYDQITKNGLGRGERIERATRNKHSVWEVATQPFPEAHFATFPPALIEPCILAGCPEKCCAKCGAPFVRETERTSVEPVDYDGKYLAADANSAGRRMLANVRARRLSGEPHDNPFPPKRTIGFSPSCSCNADIVPGTCLDPFGGAGTTGLVADRLSRNAVLIELNPEYGAMAERRIADDAGMFAEVVRL